MPAVRSEATPRQDTGSEAIRPEFSIVVPVYNEAENIIPLLRGIEQAVHGDYEILIVYDRDEDTTLPAIRGMDPPARRVRLVRNELGPGVLRALQTGFQQSWSWLGVVVTMSDLSDPPERIEDMVSRLRQGCDVVAGSRYMPGGSQVGGPRLKRTLSRLAGLSAYWLSGIGIHDLTTNFRAYSRRLLHTTPIESSGGFELGIELTVKCHLRGWRVSEVPSSWKDRSAGQSRFRLRAWLPGYLRWFWLLLRRDPLGLRCRQPRMSPPQPTGYHYFGVYDEPNYGWIVHRRRPGVIILAETTDRRLVLVRANRPYHVPGRTAWELPGGAAEPGEPVLDAARRELLEETGYRAGTTGTVLPHRIEAIPGMGSFPHVVVLLEGCTPGPRTPGEHEGIVEVAAFDDAQIEQLMSSGQIEAMPSLAGLSMRSALRPS